ncbi:hypothetical protein ACVME8_009011 [Bradyrhizobium diazoefficiens]
MVFVSDDAPRDTCSTERVPVWHPSLPLPHKGGGNGESVR